MSTAITNGACRLIAGESSRGVSAVTLRGDGDKRSHARAAFSGAVGLPDDSGLRGDGRHTLRASTGAGAFRAGGAVGLPADAGDRPAAAAPATAAPPGGDGDISAGVAGAGVA